MSSSRDTLLGGLDAQAFLHRHWQKKPLLVRAALPAFESPLNAEELAGLACEEGVEARLIEKVGDRWALENGPFDARRFGTLSNRDWTLLVQDIEKHLPEFAEYLNLFDFIPRWRVDDLMISHAVTGGGVGPHVDAYDVFLLQAKGRRRWRIAEHYNPEVIPGLDIKVLKHFDAEQEWVLEPGDMLYLPPNVAHDGVALDDDCQTWSIGFRAPSLRDMYSDFSEWLFQQLPEDAQYADPDLDAREAADGAISPAALARMRALLRNALSPSDADLDRWFGMFMTEPKPWLQSEPSEPTPGAEAFRERVSEGDDLLRDTRAQLAWSRDEGGALLFVNGEAWNAGTVSDETLTAICTQHRVRAADIRNGETFTLLQRLHAAGVVHFASLLEENHD